MSSYVVQYLRLYAVESALTLHTAIQTTELLLLRRRTSALASSSSYDHVLTIHSSEERRPLVDNKGARRTYPNGLQICLWIFLFLFFVIACIHLSIDYRNVDRPDVRDRIRSHWKWETDNHVSYNKRLDQERNERIAADEERLERQRAADTKRHEAHLIEMDMEHEQGWQAEDKRRRTAWNVRDAQVFAREQAIRRKEDAMWRDEQHRKRSRLIWESLTPDHRCLSFESRKYTAELANIPTEPDVDALKWCMETEINIRGESYAHPRRCVREGVCCSSCSLLTSD